MTHLTNISEEASVVLVSELIVELERQRLANGQPSLVEQLKAAIAQTWGESPNASPRLQIGMADAQLVLAWAQKAVAEERQAARFGDLIVEPRGREER